MISDCPKLLFLVLLAMFSASLATASQANTITFNTLPDGTPSTDDALVPLDQAYTAGGVQFRIGFDADMNGTLDVTDTQAIIEAVGGAPSLLGNGFFNDTIGTADVASSGFETRLGDYFLKAPSFSASSIKPLIIDYENAALPNFASGEIWDIDGLSLSDAERWRVDAFDTTGGILGSILSPNGPATGPGTLDGRPWLWNIDSGGIGIDKIIITFVGTKSGNSPVGLAFDNFAPSSLTAVPLPATLPLLAGGLGLFGLLGWRRKRNARV